MYNHSTTYRQAILIKHLQILGERNSGTNYLASLIQKNIPAIDITNSFGFKHWFIKDHYPRTLPNNSTDMECTRSLDDSDDTLFLVILRNPFDWLCSMAVNPYHAPKHVGLPFSTFIRKRWVSYEQTRVNSIWPLSDDGAYFIEEAENIMVLRSMKIQHWLNLRKRVKNIAFINYEALYKGMSTLENIANEFNILQVNNPFVNQERYIKGGRLRQELFVPKEQTSIDKQDLEFIQANIDWDVEKYFNYKYQNSPMSI